MGRPDPGVCHRRNAGWWLVPGKTGAGRLGRPRGLLLLAAWLSGSPPRQLPGASSAVHFPHTPPHPPHKIK